MQDVDIVYEKRFVSYLDVLGFKAIVDGPDGLKKIQEYFAALNHTLATKLDGLEIDVITISDSVILSIPVPDKSADQKRKLFEKICDAVSDFQCAMAQKNIWMRGAITYGECYISKDPVQIVGPAYIKSYELEQSTAIYPRVIIDPKIIGELGFKTDKELIDEVEVNEYSGKLFNWYQRPELVKIDKDVPLFINYLYQLFLPELNSDIHAGLNLIIDHLTDNLFTSRWSIATYSKHQWTRKYLHSLALANCPFVFSDVESPNAKINERLRHL